MSELWLLTGPRLYRWLWCWKAGVVPWDDGPCEQQLHGALRGGPYCCLILWVYWWSLQGAVWLSMEPKPESSCSWEPPCRTEDCSEDDCWLVFSFLDVALLLERWLAFTWCSCLWSFFREPLSCPRVSFFAMSSTSERLCPGTGLERAEGSFWAGEGCLALSRSSSASERLDCLGRSGWLNLHLIPYVHFLPVEEQTQDFSSAVHSLKRAQQQFKLHASKSLGICSQWQC